MQGLANDRNRISEDWPRLASRDIAAVRLAICRQLLGILAEEGGGGGHADFDEVSRFLTGWDETRVRCDPAGFCRDTVRLLSLMLAHVDAENLTLPSGIVISLD